MTKWQIVYLVSAIKSTGWILFGGLLANGLLSIHNRQVPTNTNGIQNALHSIERSLNNLANRRGL